MRILRLPIIGPGRIEAGGELKKRRDLIAPGKLSPSCIRREGLAMTNLPRVDASRAEGYNRALTETAAQGR
ncbi:hypothetical protein JMK10_09840 [Rhodovulum sulfidophilum]|uniref:hypothetical protein n=1 Tax=Rhodovulum sulfidophilum TaxID=35806 RepID=UPI001924622C|nr:hypothetical protein [Rhodovulum sulfidophilum]MBL3572787.1 hypothetical protein [Rhodovulum sulfidophilum]MCE8430356.1 hypothetical protein [Rhodovulum sulfidophilum]MCF4117104.1 hypothetical protein [Rhodovulum sulfidophilum]